ncbi:MAG TPA: hypothetical protein DER56_06280 [Thermosipho africanus]|nr:hypothetical protein [Thermosipho africanus]
MIIVCKKLNYDRTGNRRYEYNFFTDEGLNISDQIEIGRKTKDGRTSQQEPFLIKQQLPDALFLEI